MKYILITCLLLLIVVAPIHAKPASSLPWEVGPAASVCPTIAYDRGDVPMAAAAPATRPLVLASSVKTSAAAPPSVVDFSSLIPSSGGFVGITSAGLTKGAVNLSYDFNIGKYPFAFDVLIFPNAVGAGVSTPVQTGLEITRLSKYTSQVKPVDWVAKHVSIGGSLAGNGEQWRPKFFSVYYKLDLLSKGF